MSAVPSTYQGFLYGPIGQRIYPSPLDSPGKYRPRQYISREIKKSISQFDHAELISLSTQLCARIPALRAAIRDKNSWAFAHWSPLFLGDNEKWGEEVEEWLMHEVFPNACFHELRPDYAWNMRVSGMGLDIHGDDLSIFTEDEYHNPRIMFIPGPRIGNGPGGGGFLSTVMNLASGITTRPDGQSIVDDGRYKGYPIYNGIIRIKGRPVCARVLGTDDKGEPTFVDLDLGFNFGTHYASECEWFGQGRPVPRVASGVLQWMKKEEIDDQLLKALGLAATKMVVHQLPPGQDAEMARGNAIVQSTLTRDALDSNGFPITDGSGNTKQIEHQVFAEYLPDGNVMYIGSDENLEGLDYTNPSSDVEAFAMRVSMELLSDLGWSLKLLTSDGTSGAPTRLEVQKANNSVHDRQTIEKARTIQFIRYAVSKGIQEGKIPRNDDGSGMDSMRWGIGFPAELTVDAGNDVTASLQRLKMGLTNERIESAKSGHVAKHILRQRLKEISAKAIAADTIYKQITGMGHKDFTFQKAMELFYQPNPNSSANVKMQEELENPDQPGAKPPKQK